MKVDVAHSDMLEWLGSYDGEPFDSCVTDPPYHLTSIVKRFGGANAARAKDRDGLYKRASRGFMGKTWDGGDVAQRPETWRAVYDALKPGAHLIAFAGTRTFHRMTVAIEDAGFEIRDMLCWHYGSGFPKSHNQKDDFEGWGTALKPALEAICLARKPLGEKTVAANLARYGTGALNIKDCRIGGGEALREGAGKLWSHYREGEASSDRRYDDRGGTNFAMKPGPRGGDPLGRWPANVMHDGSDEVVGMFPESNGQQGDLNGHSRDRVSLGIYGDMGAARDFVSRNDEGSAARFFYSAKAGPLDRLGTAHATVKPVDLMRWLVRLVTPTGGRVLDPFAGSGTTGIACMAEGFDCQMIELEAEHVTDIQRKLNYLRGKGGLTVIEKHKAKRDREVKDGALDDAGPLFKGAA